MLIIYNLFYIYFFCRAVSRDELETHAEKTTANHTLCGRNEEKVAVNKSPCRSFFFTQKKHLRSD